MRVIFMLSVFFTPALLTDNSSRTEGELHRALLNDYNPNRIRNSTWTERDLHWALFKDSNSTIITNSTRTERDLHRTLFKDYNPDVIPIVGKSGTVNVSVDIYIMSINSIDEKGQTFTLRGFLEVKWTDQFLTWRPNDFGGVKKINVKNENIWLPDLALTNIYDSPTEMGQRDGRTSINNNGQCVMWPYKSFKVGCKINIRKFPFDVQVCEMDFVSWTNPNSLLRLKTTSDTLSFWYYKESSEWEIGSYRIRHYLNPHGNDVWDHVEFQFTLKRKWLFYVLNMIVPIMCISFLNITCFIIPSESGERVTLCISSFLTLAVFLTVMSSFLPESSDEVCLFGIYVGLQLLCSGLTILGTVISLHLYHKNSTEAVPFYYRLLAIMFCQIKTSSGHTQHTHMNGHTLTDEESVSKKSTVMIENAYLSWVLVARAFDRLCLWLSIVWNLALIIGLVCAFRS